MTTGGSGREKHPLTQEVRRVTRDDVDSMECGCEPYSAREKHVGEKWIRQPCLNANAPDADNCEKTVLVPEGHAGEDWICGECMG